MRNRTLVEDYLKRARHRLYALDTLYERQSWADVVREAQEIVELALKALLRHARIEVPQIHDVGPILKDHAGRLPSLSAKEIGELVAISKALRRDRELSFYGSEDLTPSEFYEEADAAQAREQARKVVDTAESVFKP